jgi:uncharacterized protein (TIGR03435 family)
MHEPDDHDLLRQYAEQNSETAFAALVARHVDKVYSTALRHTRNAHAAEEITQAVFVILAKKSGRLGAKVILAGWLYETARLTAVTYIRSEIRRARREQEAHMTTALNENADAAWPHIAPLLDDALAGLSAADRHAVVLRYFDGKSLGEVGAALGASEDAAKKRVTRAVEKLRGWFTKRGVTLTATVLTAAISANSVQAAPLGLAATVTVTALKGAAFSGSTLTLIKGALKIMAWTKMKTAVAVGVGLLLAAGTATVTVKEIQKHRTYPWQVPKASYEVFYNMPAAVKVMPTKFKENGGLCCDGGRGAMGIAQQLKDILQIAYRKNKFYTVVTTDLPTEKYDFIAKLVGAREPSKTIPNNENWSVELQKEIANKFGITGRLEIREADVMILKPSRTGTRNFKVSNQMPNGNALRNIVEPTPTNLNVGYRYHQQPISTLLNHVEQVIRMPLIDKTGLMTNYDYSITWPQPFPTGNKVKMELPSIEILKQSLLDQLGLELMPSRAPVEMLVVEKVK